MNEPIEALLTVDPSELDDDGRLETLAALTGLIARAQARVQRVSAAIAADPPTAPGVPPAAVLDKQWVREEVAYLLRLAPVTAANQLALARHLVDHSPATLTLLEAGQISLGHAQSLVDATVGVDDTARAKIEAHVLAKAPSQTVGELRRALKRAVCMPTCPPTGRRRCGNASRPTPTRRRH